MSKRDRGADPGPEEPAPFHNPFGGLAERLGMSPEPARPGPPPPPAAPSRAVVRLERKGRGGREVTLVEKLDLSQEALARWLKELKQALGCGGAVEGDALCLQGDLRGRLKELLAARGVRKITMG